MSSASIRLLEKRDQTRCYSNVMLLSTFLTSKRFARVWTILGEKQILSVTGDSPGWAAISGAFRLRSDGVEGSLNYFPELRENADQRTLTRVTYRS